MMTKAASNTATTPTNMSRSRTISAIVDNISGLRYGASLTRQAALSWVRHVENESGEPMGGQLYTAAEIERLHYGPDAQS